MSKRMTHIEYCERVFDCHQHEITVVGVYQRMHDKIEFEHFCGHRWFSAPNDILKGHGCPSCSYVARGLKSRTSQEDFQKAIFRIHGPDITVFGEYEGKKTHILVRHSCGYEWSPSPGNLLKGSSCPKCVAGKDLFRRDTYIMDVMKIHKNEIKVLEPYKTSDTPILHRHEVCGHEWKPIPYHVLKGHGCPLCSKRMFLGQERYVESVYRIHGDNIKVIGQYAGANIPIVHFHESCGRQWITTPQNIRRGGGCLLCSREQINFNRKKFILDGKTFNVQGYEDRAIRYIVEEMGIDVKHIITGAGVPHFMYSHKGKIKRYFPDIFIPSENLIIEVKSTYTLGIKNLNSDVLEMNQAKANSVTFPFTYGTLVLGKTNKIEQPILLPENWHKLSVIEITNLVGSLL